MDGVLIYLDDVLVFADSIDALMGKMTEAL